LALAAGLRPERVTTAGVRVAEAAGERAEPEDGGPHAHVREVAPALAEARAPACRIQPSARAGRESLDGAIDRIAQARGALASGDRAATGEALGKALGIIGGLQGCLDRDRGGEVAANLDRLYDYMTRRLADVHRGEGAAPLDEVSGLLITIRSGWEGIRSHLPVESPSS
ncbi:MAG TPA: flagellar protein FliS, partial [Pseudomonadales bacterium]|nr:flagellar protein FliS [Pseudomonadales bacterium]